MKTRWSLLLLPLILLISTVNPDAQTIATLHNFSSLTTLTNIQGSFPAAAMIRSGNTLYGTTSSGGTSFQGTIFKINTDGTGYLGLYSFTSGNDGGNPAASLLLVGNTLFGTAQNGGASNNGVVFAINTDGSGFTNLYSFTGGDDGAHPACNLVLSGNKLYGTTQNGGPDKSGSVFALSTNGQNFLNLYNFTGGNDGALPLAGLILSNGTLFGTTSQSGSNFYGTVFSFTIASSVFSNIYDFSGFADGSSPSANLLLSGNTLYGTTSSGGSSFSGTVFAVNTDGSGFTNLHFFTGADDGSDPLAALTINGNLLYGTAESGGAFGNGNIFAVNINGSGFTNLHSFSQKDTNFDNSDGANPEAGLVLVGNTLFGTASSGGLNYGTIFAMDVSGAPFSTLLPFYPYSSGLPYQANSDGANPSGGMAISASNILFGTAQNGGAWGYGTVFSMLTNGSNFSTLYNFRGENDGAVPVGGLVLSNGVLYGAARNGGNFQAGLLYSVPTNGGNANVVYAFSPLDFQFHNSDGTQPVGDLSLSGNRIYGAASTGGTAGNGTLFAVNTDGNDFTNLHNFSSKDSNGINSDGAKPNGGLLLANNIIYGTAQNGGGNGFGTVYSVHTDGSAFMTLYSFTGSNDGANPMAGLFLTNNILYGSTANGGANNSGTLFTININGSGFSNFYTFNGFTDGANPQSRLVGDSLYQINPNGGSSFEGSILQIGADGSNPISLSFQSANGSQPSGPPIFSGYTLFAVASFGGSAGNGTLWSVAGQFPSQNIFLTPPSGPATTIASGGTFSGFFPLNTTVNFQVTLGQTLPGTAPQSVQLVSGSLAPGLNLIEDGSGAWRITGTVNTPGNYSGRLALLYPFHTEQLGFDTGICLAPAVQNVFPVNGLSSLVNPGDHVLINGSGLSGTTWVLFGYLNGAGTAATSVSVVNDSQLNVTVPTGAKSGRIRVDTGCSSVVSARPLIIGPAPVIPLLSPLLGPSGFTFKITDNPNIPPELRGGLMVIQESTDLKTWTNKQTNDIPTNSDEEEFSIPFPFGGLVVPKDFYRAYIESFNSPLPLPHP